MPESLIQDDRLFIERLYENDEEAFEQLFKMYFKQLSIYSYFIVYNNSDALDCAQEAFIALSVQIHREEFNSIRSIYSYLRTITHRRSVDIIRQRVARKEVPFDSNMDSRKERSTLKQITEQEINHVLIEAINEIPNALQNTVKMRYFDGFIL